MHPKQKHKQVSKFTIRLSVVYSAVFTLLIIVFMVVSVVYIVRTGETLSMLNQNEFASSALTAVEGFLIELDDLSYQVMTNSRLLNLFHGLQAKDELEEPLIEGEATSENLIPINDKTNIFDENILLNIDTGSLLGNINRPQAMVWRISVYNEYGDYIHSGATIDKKVANTYLQSQNVDDMMVYLRDTPSKMEIIPPSEDTWSNYYSDKYIIVRRPLMNFYSQEVYGVVELQQTLKRLTTLLEFDTLTNINVTVFSNDGSVITSTYKGGEISPSDYSVTKTSEQYGWSVTLTQSRKDMLKPYMPLIGMVIFSCLVLIVLVSTVINLIAHHLSAPLVALKKTVSKISYGSDMPKAFEENNIDEVRELGVAFDSMLERITDSVRLEKNAMMLALQTQMNPHFFHNVITVISSAALEGKNEQVIHMCEQMCSILRYTSSFKDTVITVSDELAHTTAYLELMKYRYEEYFTYTINVEESALSKHIPRLVLQPIAENCFDHGFLGIEPPYHIDITITNANNRLEIRVQDNGMGISEEDTQKLMNSIEHYSQNLKESYRELRIGGLGLVNTALRLKNNVANPATLIIQNAIPRGTVVIIKEL